MEINQMERTEELRLKNAEKNYETTGPRTFDNPPWLKWGDEKYWIEGKVTKTFNPGHGICVEMNIEEVREKGQIFAHGTNDNNEKYQVAVQPNMAVALPVHSASLKGQINEGDEGKKFHIAFEGWIKSKKNEGYKFRAFSVFELKDDDILPSDLPF
tara:strand:+ start:627 stop:1094 length:468 start_codon:yes stop_codon:yes gene_type:complete